MNFINRYATITTTTCKVVLLRHYNVNAHIYSVGNSLAGIFPQSVMMRVVGCNRGVGSKFVVVRPTLLFVACSSNGTLLSKGHP